MKEHVDLISSDLPLAKLFNRILFKVETIRVMSSPRIFDDLHGEMATEKMQNFYETILWEKWIQGVWKRLEDWAEVINGYFEEYNGSWEYYALSQRLDFIKQWGSDDVDDYNPDGSIKTEEITREQLKYHTVFKDLYFKECFDIVQDTKPNDLFSLVCSLGALSNMSVIDVLQDISSKQVPIFIADGQGGLRQASFVDKTEVKLNQTIEADNLGQQIYLIAQRMEMLTERIKSYADSERAFDDNKEMLNRLLRDVDTLMHLRLDEICNLEVEC